MKINYQLVYELREFEQAIFIKQAAVQKAREAAEDAILAYKDACTKLTGVPATSLEFSNTACLAKGIAHHVYHIKINSRHGSPENKCIFCGCDNWAD